MPRITAQEMYEICERSLPWAGMMGFEIAEANGPVAHVTATYSIPPGSIPPGSIPPERDGG